MNKHAIKGWLRGAYCRFVAYTGLWRIFSRLSGRRMVILAGHCVGDVPGLPADMTLSEARVREITRVLSKGFAWAHDRRGVRRDSCGPSGAEPGRLVL